MLGYVALRPAAFTGKRDALRAQQQPTARISDEPKIKRLEQHAAERTLQILIEFAIGLAKSWAKKELGFTSNEALSAFHNLADRGYIAKTPSWRKIIGLRNVLVHDYLNVDVQIVCDVILQGYYQEILAFGRKAINVLREAQ